MKCLIAIAAVLLVAAGCANRATHLPRPLARPPDATQARPELPCPGPMQHDPAGNAPPHNKRRAPAPTGPTRPIGPP